MTDYLTGLIDKFWSFVAGTSDEFTDPDSFGFVSNFFKSFFRVILRWLSDGWSFLAGEITSFVYSILFDNYDSTVQSGKSAVDRIFNFQSSGDAFSVDMIYFFFGCVFTVFIFKFVLNIILSFIRFPKL